MKINHAKPWLVPVSLLIFLATATRGSLTSPFSSDLVSSLDASTKSTLESSIVSKHLIDVDAKVIDDTLERKLTPRTIRDDQVIKKQTGGPDLVDDNEINLKDEDLQKSIWDEESIYKNDLESGHDTPNASPNVAGLINDVHVLNSQIQSSISQMDRPVPVVPPTTSVTLPNNDDKDKHAVSVATSKITDDKQAKEKNSQEKRKLTMFKNYLIRKRYTLNPEIDFTPEDLVAMPRKPKQELVVGILTLPISHILKNKIRKAIKEKVNPSEFPAYSHILNDMTFYPSSYAKWLEHNGVKTVPITINQDISKIYLLIDQLDGLLLTGGATPLFLKNNIIQVDSTGVGSSTKIKHPSDYLNIVGQIIRYAKKKNLDKPFPVWGTCLGFEAIVLDESRLSVTMSFVHNNNKNLMNALQGPASSYRLTSFLTPEEVSILEKQSSSFYNHDYAFTVHNFLKNHWLNNQYDLIGTTKAGATTIVSMIEHKTLPIYGVQFHPEKIIYENVNRNLITKDPKAKQLSNKLSMFFVSGSTPRTELINRGAQIRRQVRGESAQTEKADQIDQSQAHRLPHQKRRGF